MAAPCQRCGYENTEEAKFCLQCGAMVEIEVADPNDPMLGKVLLGRYRVIQVLGEGGMGKVYLAEQKMGTATRKVAIKTLHPELSTDPQLVARFHRECETVIELHHPNTVQFYDFGDLEDKTLFIVMEFIEGEDLARRLQRGPLDMATADKLLIQICGSLSEAHQRGVVHRDLKPENVLLTTRGGQTDFVKVLDFGIAKRSEAEDESKAKLTKQGMVLGTPPYMSPEQFSGQTLDLRSDIYSLGVMTYEMITGVLPFEAKTPWEWATKHLTTQPTPLEAHPAGAALPPNKKNAIMRALAKNRDERHGDVLTFMHEFTGLADAQVAWTMATSSGAGSGSAPGASRPAISTPQGVASNYSTPGVDARFGGGTAPVAQPQSSPGMSYPSGVVPGLHPTGGSGKGWIVALVALFILLGGAAGGGYWWWKQQSALASNDPQNPIVDPINDPSMNPTMNPSIMVTMVEPTMMVETMEPTMVEVAMVEETMEPETMEPEGTMIGVTMVEMVGMTSGDDARARRFVNAGSAALQAGNFNGAISNLQQAQRADRSNAAVRRFKNELGQRGSNQIGNLMLRGNCRGAQQLYRQLNRVGAARQSRQHFSGDWCPQP